MEIESKKHLEDIRKAADRVRRFTEGKTFDNYMHDDLLKSGVERQFEIIGEAMTKLHRLNPDIVMRISNYKRIIAFRNILVHGYAFVDDKIVWDVVQKDLPVLLEEIETLLS